MTNVLGPIYYSVNNLNTDALLREARRLFTKLQIKDERTAQLLQAINPTRRFTTVVDLPSNKIELVPYVTVLRALDQQHPVTVNDVSNLMGNLRLCQTSDKGPASEQKFVQTRNQALIWTDFAEYLDGVAKTCNLKSWKVPSVLTTKEKSVYNTAADVFNSKSNFKTTVVTSADRRNITITVDNAAPPKLDKYDWRLGNVPDCIDTLTANPKRHRQFLDTIPYLTDADVISIRSWITDITANNELYAHCFEAIKRHSGLQDITTAGKSQVGQVWMYMNAEQNVPSADDPTLTEAQKAQVRRDNQERRVLRKAPLPQTIKAGVTLSGLECGGGGYCGWLSIDRMLTDAAFSKDVDPDITTAINQSADKKVWLIKYLQLALEHKHVSWSVLRRAANIALLERLSETPMYRNDIKGKFEAELPSAAFSDELSEEQTTELDNFRKALARTLGDLRTVPWFNTIWEVMLVHTPLFVRNNIDLHSLASIPLSSEERQRLGITKGYKLTGMFSQRTEQNLPNELILLNIADGHFQAAKLNDRLVQKLPADSPLRLFKTSLTQTGGAYFLQ